MSHVLLVQGNARRMPLADKSVSMVCTSPPYWGLRSYGIGGAHGEIGTEATHDCLGWATGERCETCYICVMVTVFQEVKRILHPTGTLWINIGDSYANDGKWGGATGGKHVQALHGQAIGRAKRKTGLKPKDLCGIPQRLALALQADGWYWRSEIVWSKTCPMPESVKDRPTRSHEQVLLFSKQERYFWDSDAVRQAYSASGLNDALHQYRYGRKVNSKHAQLVATGIHGGDWFDDPSVTRDAFYQRGGANLRTVWQITPECSSVPHFAVFPTELVRRCVLAGTSEHGVCSGCRAPWRREVERQRLLDGQPFETEAFSRHDEPYRIKPNGIGHARYSTRRHDHGWLPTCDCDAPLAAAVVFDPFVGSGTTVHVACALGRDGVGTDLSYPYLRDIAQPRIAPTFAQPGLFEPRSNGVVHAGLPQQTTLFGESLGKESR